MAHDRKYDITEDREALRKLPTFVIVKLFLEKEEPVFDEKTQHLNSAEKQALSNELIMRITHLSDDDTKLLGEIKDKLEKQSTLTEREHVVMGMIYIWTGCDHNKGFAHYLQATKSPLRIYLAGACYQSGTGVHQDWILCYIISMSLN